MRYKHSVQRADLRHACATLLLIKGVHPKIVQEMLGHSSIPLHATRRSSLIPSALNDPPVVALVEEESVEQVQLVAGVPYLLFTVALYDALLLGLIHPYLLSQSDNNTIHPCWVRRCLSDISTLSCPPPYLDPSRPPGRP